MNATQAHLELLFAPASAPLAGREVACAKVSELRVSAISSILQAIIIILLVLVLLLVHEGMRLMV